MLVRSLFDFEEALLFFEIENTDRSLKFTYVDSFATDLLPVHFTKVLHLRILIDENCL